MNKKKVFIGLGTLAVIGCLYFAYQYFFYVTTDNAQVEAHSVMLASKVGGYIQSVNVTEGQTVKKGDLLVVIDPRDYENTLTQAKGELSSLEARRRDAERNFQRLRGLLSTGAVSQQQFDTASASYQETKARYEGLAAQVAQAELNLGNTKIIAPSNGVIARKSAEVGQLASPGVPLLGFVSSEERWVTANFKETDVESIRLGAKAHIDVDAVSSRKFEGKVVAISAATGATFTLLPPDNATGNFTKVVQRVPVKIEFEGLKPEDMNLLRAGLSADVKISKH
jgi:membrane fusion protein (multidrug efflux system)